MDLITFNSPPKLETSTTSKPPVSPGNNPFDTVLQAAERPAVNETNLLDMAFMEGTTFLFTQTLSSSDNRDSLSVPNLNTDDCGRESLGILHINFDELNSENIDQNTLSVPISCKSSYHSFLKSISSRSSISSQPSTIYSLSPSSRISSELFNVAMSPTLIEKHLTAANVLIVAPRKANSVCCLEREHFDGCRKRLSSEPATLQHVKTDLEKKDGGNIFFPQDFVCEASVQTQDKSLEDLVFIEGGYIASKIADGSILEESNGNILDSTPQPDFVEIPDNVPEEDTKKCDTETVFKLIDKMVPDSSKNSSDSSNSSDNLKANSSRSSAKEAIQNLAEILKSEHINVKRKAEGQNLLMSLAGILCNENNSVLNDSGHSSIELEQDVQEKSEVYEILDLRKKSSSSENEQVEALDLSMCAKKLSDTPKFTPPYFNKRASMSLKETPNGIKEQSGMSRRASESSLPSSSKEITRNLSNQTGSSNASSTASLVNSGPIVGKLKFKKSSNVKIGPVKATVGLTNKIPMSTSPKTIPEASKIKKTSTPVNKSKIKPIAQSTPEENKSLVQEVAKKKFQLPMSPLSRPNKLDTSTQNKSSSDPNLSTNSSVYGQKMARSNSVSNVKNKTTLSPMMRRSFSSGKGVGMNKTKETSGIRKNLAENVLNRSLNSKPFSLLSKLKKGKENLFH